jgi:uncharacterized membrane protein YphA (DoxX/SURF4 family)
MEAKRALRVEHMCSYMGRLWARDITDLLESGWFHGKKTRRLAALARDVDDRVVRFMSANGLTLLRLALGLVFIWFGALKIVGQSPVGDLVADTVYWLPADPFVRFLGIWEVTIGAGLLLGIALRLVLLLFFLQMAGTFLVLVTQPGEAFDGRNLFLLTTEGEFVIKNLVLITAGLVLGSTVRRRQADSRDSPRYATGAPEKPPVSTGDSVSYP